MRGVLHFVGCGSGRGALVGGVPPPHADLILGELADHAGLERDEGLGGGVVEVGDEVAQHDVLTAAHRFAGVQSGVDHDLLLDRLDGDMAEGVEGDELGDELHQTLAHWGEHVGLARLVITSDVAWQDLDFRKLAWIEDHVGATGWGIEHDQHNDQFLSVRSGTRVSQTDKRNINTSVAKSQYFVI